MDAATGVPIKPVLVHFEDERDDRPASTVEDLMGMLMSDGWPKRPNDTVWGKALSSCMSAITTQSGSARARRAFVEAAHLAQFRVLPDDDLPKSRRNGRLGTARDAGRSTRLSADHSR